ncbi:MAG: hypothetical protein AAF862_11235 [Pseudomonadota bacterium]
MPHLKPLFVLCLALGIAACGSKPPAQTSLPPKEPDVTPGGPDWLIPPPPPKEETKTAAYVPDIAIPLQGLAGLWSGSRFDAGLSIETRKKMIDLTQAALSQGAAGKTVKWRASGLEGTVVPQMVFVGPAGLECREFHQTLRRGKDVETGYATACVAEDGRWRILVE